MARFFDEVDTGSSLHIHSINPEKTFICHALLFSGKIKDG
jgi:hypothetical protein